jgi:protein-tyrosine sulfotransferase
MTARSEGHTKTDTARAVFILGILPRSGTAFLQDLLCLYPGFGKPRAANEDYCLYYSDPLASFAEKLVAHWSASWKVPSEYQRRLESRIGEGIVSFLSEVTQADSFVTKTPRVDNLHNFPKFFPAAHLLIVVRDGRSVLESGIRTFGWNREAAMHQWADAAQTILQFEATYKKSALKYRVIRYEDLWSNVEHEMARILAFLELDPMQYDFEAARRLPIRGSSDLRSKEGKDVHWRPVTKTADFDPLSRWKHWTPKQVERFDWVAGPYLAALGYERPPRRTSRIVWYVRNRAADLAWLAIRVFGPFVLRMKAFLVARRRSPEQAA